MGEFAEMEILIEEDPLRETGEEFAEMEKHIEEYFSTVSDEQLAKDLKKAGYEGKLGPSDSNRWFAIGVSIVIGTALLTFGYFIQRLIAWITWVPS